jgi:PAS domain S-box-containing protein
MVDIDKSVFAPETGDPRRLTEALHRARELLSLAEQSAGIGIWDVDLATGLVRGNAQFFRVMGLPPSAEPVPIERMRALRHPEDARKVVDGYRASVARGEDIYEVEYRIVREDGEIRWIFGRGRTVRDASGKPVRYSGVDIDVTERRRSHEALRESEERFSKAFHSASHSMSITTLAEGRYLDMNVAAEEACGLPRAQVIGRTVKELGFYEDVTQFTHLRELLKQQGHFSSVEVNLRGRDGVRTYLLSGATIELRGEPCLLTSAIDITARKRAEEHVRLLMDEVNHRANNLLAVVQAIAHETADGTDPKTFVMRLNQRLAALAVSNRLLVSGKWQGADMAALVRSQLSPFADPSGPRIMIDGPAVQLKAPAVQAIGMALHELATNAGKYGALSTSHGMVRIEWRLEGDVEDGRFVVSWLERGGPAVDPPGRRGFGHTVVVHMIEGSLGAKAALDFAPAGVSWHLSGPAAMVLEPAINPIGKLPETA